MAHLGSVSASLGIPEALRPWSQSGLTHLFVPGGLAEPASVPAQDGSPAPDDSVASIPRPKPLPRWPEPWKSLAERVRTAPRVVITYPELALDLSGTPHLGRRKLFRDILAYLAWPQGTTLFWPMGSLKEGKTVLAPDCFASGVRHFPVAHVACFGEAAFRSCSTLLTLESDPTTISLPAPDDLLDLLPHELHRALSALKSLVLK